MDQSEKEKADLQFKHRGGCVNYDHCAWWGRPGCSGCSAASLWGALSRCDPGAPGRGLWTLSDTRDTPGAWLPSLFYFPHYWQLFLESLTAHPRSKFVGIQQLCDSQYFPWECFCDFESQSLKSGHWAAWVSLAAAWGAPRSGRGSRTAWSSRPGKWDLLLHILRMPHYDERKYPLRSFCRNLKKIRRIIQILT